MNLLSLAVKVICDDQASSAIGRISSNVRSGLATAARAATVAVGAATAGAVAVGKSALDAYASYEQLVGGVDKLYGAASGKLQAYAAQAYQTAGMSANQYMEQATSFSAALVTSLGGDVDKAAEQTDVAMRAMADNVNVFGSSMTDVQNAFQGFAKQNYTMLDNLKLGYGGTKEEMQRLIDDANALRVSMGQTGDLSIESFSDVVTAIDTVQTHMGITGTTAQEAAHTIAGSVSMMKASWQNWLTALADPDQDLGVLSDQLVESVITAAENVVPRAAQIAVRMGEAITKQLPAVGEKIMAALQNILSPAQFEAVRSIVSALSSVFSTLAQVFQEHVLPALQNLFLQLGPLLEALAPIAQLVGGVLLTAFSAFVNVLSVVVGAVTGIIRWFTSLHDAVSGAADSAGEGTKKIIDFFSKLPEAIGNFLSEVIEGIVAFASTAIDAANRTGSEFFSRIRNFFSQLPAMVANVLYSAVSYIRSFVSNAINSAHSAGSGFLNGIRNGFNSAVNFVQSIPSRIVSALGNVGRLLFNSGRSIVYGLANGIRNAVGAATSAISSVLNRIRRFLPFSPAKEGPFSGKGWTLYSGQSIVGGLADGISGSASAAVSAMRDVMGAVSDVPYSLAYGGAYGEIRSEGYRNVVLNVTVNGAGKDAREIAQELYDLEQNYDRGWK